MSGIGIVIVVLIIIAVYAVIEYNGFVSLRNRVVESWSDIEVQMKRRYDLIPNLVNTVKGYAKHESETLENVIKARHTAMEQQHNMQERSQSESMLSSTLKSLFAVSENYPELKANQNFLELQHELRDTEDKLQAARRFYNGNVLS
ncbi:MAG: LemA family protein, partial [Elusimicrobiaceae bacterium]|nr:LemA family protein [Elusimicrobiaceae bacterium]